MVLLLFVILFAFISLQEVFKFIFAGIEKYIDTSSEENNFFSVFSIILLNFIPWGIVLVFGFIKTERKFNEVFKFNRVSLFLWIAIIIFMAGYYYIIMFELPIFLEYIMPKSERYQNPLERINIINIINSVIFLPILYEMFFRGLILDGLKNNYSKRKAIIMSALIYLIFALIHALISALSQQPFGLTIILQTFIFGLFAAWICINTNSILLCIYMQLFYNVLNIILIKKPILIKVFSPINITSAEYKPWYYITGFAIFILGIILLKMGFKKTKAITKNIKENSYSMTVQFPIDAKLILIIVSSISVMLYLVVCIFDVAYRSTTSDTNTRYIIIFVIFFYISILITGYAVSFSRKISNSIKMLAVAAHDIGEGKFDTPLKTEKRNDEIGVLMENFQKMCDGLKVFGKFTNKEVAVKAMRGEIKLEGINKYAAILFCDIRDFTAKSDQFTKVFGEKDASYRIVRWLNQYFTKMIDCIENTNGVVDKFIGDAVMAHWGTISSAGKREDAYNSVRAALMMREALLLMNKERQQGDPANPPIRMGCGINSGIVTAGQIGSDTRMEYTIIGDPVNITSRIEGLTKNNSTDILISEEIWNLTRDKFITEEMPSEMVKGKEKPVRIFAVIDFADKAEES